MPSLTPASAGTETLTALAEIVGADAYTIPGLLPASSLYPGLVYPRDNVFIPAVVGPVLGARAEDSLTLAPLGEV